MNENRPTPADRIQQINAELSGLFSVEPAPLRTGSTLRGRDPLIVCGVLGGKDAGKSTLINAIAGCEVSVDRAVVGAGTSVPIAYVYEEAESAFTARFSVATARRVDHRIQTHTAPSIRNLVLVDLPDIDSTFREHLETVHRAVERMDRVIWVFDPKKGDDRAMADLLVRVVRDPANVYCVLNKFDEALMDATDGDDADGFWTAKSGWFGQCLGSLGLSPRDGTSFIVSARYPDPASFRDAVARSWWGDSIHAVDERDASFVRRLADRAAADMRRLRTGILAPLTADEVKSIKRANASAELVANIDDLERHYDLATAADRFEAWLEEVDVQYARELDAAYVTTVARRLARSGRSDVDLASELMSSRVDRWPLLRIIYWPLSGLVRWLGGRLVPAAEDRATMPVTDLLRVQGRSLVHRIAVVYERARLSASALPQSIGRVDRQPDAEAAAAAAEARVADRWRDMDDDVLIRCHADDRRSGRLARLGLWLVLLWFPLLQPLLDGVLRLAVERNLASGLRSAWTIIHTLSALALVKGLAASVCVFLLVLAVMFARCVRDVRRERGVDAGRPDDSSTHFDEVAQVLADEIVVPLREPVEQVTRRVRACLSELADLRGSME